MSRIVFILLGITLIFSLFLGARKLLADEKNKDIASECMTSRFPILLYHHIREYENILHPLAKSLSVSPEEFAIQMRYLHEHNWKTITPSEIQKKVPCKTLVITFDDGYYDVYKNAFPAMKEYGYSGVLGLIPAYIDESDYLTGQQIKELLKNNWEIASHTWHHPILTKTPIKFLEREINTSKYDLEKWFGKPVNTFVYPGGFYGPKTLEQVAKSGYKYGFTTHPGYAEIGENNYELKRINITPGTTPEKLEELLASMEN